MMVSSSMFVLFLLLLSIVTVTSSSQVDASSQGKNRTVHRRSLKKHKAYSYKSASQQEYDDDHFDNDEEEEVTEKIDNTDEKQEHEPVNTSNSCSSLIADQLRRRVPAVVTFTPSRCCSYYGPTAVIVTHGLVQKRNGNMELYWDEFYRQLEEQAANNNNLCFIMTAIDVDQLSAAQSVTEILVDVNTAAATNSQIPVLFTTDPADNNNDLTLVNTLRTIADLTFGPLVAVFHQGYDSVLKEALVSGSPPLPYVGTTTHNNNYGSRAAETTLELVQQTKDMNDVMALCLNARTDLPFVGERCRMYYDGFGTAAPLWPPTGLACSDQSSVLRLAELYQVNRITAVYAHGECCAVAVQAAAEMSEWEITVGCMDETVQGAAFVIGPSVPLQAFHVMSQIYFPIQAILRDDYDLITPFFPSPTSLVRTDVYATVL